MGSKLYVALAATIGIVLAVLLFRAPDTGTAIGGPAPAAPEVARIPAAADTPADAPKGAPEPADTPAPEPADPSTERPVPSGPTPGTARPLDVASTNTRASELAERRKQPDSVLAGRLTGAWTMVRRALAAKEDTAEVNQKVSQTILALREARRHPDDASFDDLESTQKDLAAALRAGGHGDDPEVSNQLQRIETLWSDFRASHE